jgi:hypothetical protein
MVKFVKKMVYEPWLLNVNSGVIFSMRYADYSSNSIIFVYITCLSTLASIF